MGLKIPRRSTKGEIRASLLMRKERGTSPTERRNTGKMKKGMSLSTSYEGMETTERVKRMVTMSFALGSSLWMEVPRRERSSRTLRSM